MSDKCFMYDRCGDCPDYGTCCEKKDDQMTYDDYETQMFMEEQREQSTFIRNEVKKEYEDKIRNLETMLGDFRVGKLNTPISKSSFEKICIKYRNFIEFRDSVEKLGIGTESFYDDVLMIVDELAYGYLGDEAYRIFLDYNYMISNTGDQDWFKKKGVKDIETLYNLLVNEVWSKD